MTSKEKTVLAAHTGHNVVIVDYMPGEPIQDDDGGRFCLECLDCEEILLGDRVMVGSVRPVSVSLG